MLTIYGADLSTPANKVRFVANALNLSYEYKQVRIRDGEHRRPEFLQLNPAGKVPVIDDDGFVLFESNAIIKYLADKAGSDFYPKDSAPRAKIDQWIDFVSLHVGAAMNRIAFNRLFAPLAKVEVDERSLSDGLSFLKKFLPVIDDQLKNSRFLAAEQMTLADFNLLAVLDPAELSKVDLRGLRHITNWRDDLKTKDFYTKCHQQYGEILKEIMPGRSL